MRSRTAPPLLRQPRRPIATVTTLAVIVAGVTAFALAGCSSIFGGGVIDTTGTVAFETPLTIPPLAPGAVDPAGTRVFDLTAQAGTTKFQPGSETATWGYNQSYLGPTIVTDRGENVRVDVTNNLDVATSVHWHGMHLPAKMDGGPHQMVEPGATWHPQWTIDQPAATLWYHPHPDRETEHQVEMGLAGMVILHDDEERSLDLPHTYGVDDIPVMVQDRRFDDRGQFTTGTRGFVGPVGDEVLVNGTLGPYLEVTTDVVRLRLLNASSARIYTFGFADGKAFTLIATDGGLVTAPVPMQGIRLSPGERAEVLVAMAPGETATLRSTPPELGIQDSVAAMNAGRDTLDVLQLRAADTLAPEGPMPMALADFGRMRESDATVNRSFEMSGTSINGQDMQMSRIDQTVEVGSTEIWTVYNSQSMPHSFHVHDVQFQVLSIDGTEPPPELAGWKDTVYLIPDIDYRLIMTFTDYTDPDFPYMYHCHLLAHEDRGMMGQFVVVLPGQAAGHPPTAHDSADSPRDGRGPRMEVVNHEH